MPDNSSTTVPSITSRVRSMSSRIPFWVINCQIVSESEIGTTPTIASATHGCFERAAERANAPVKRAGTKSRKLIRRNLTNPSALRLMRPYKAPTWSWARIERSTFMRWAIEANAHVLVDARASVLDEISAEHVHGLAYQVSQADQAQVNARFPHGDGRGQSLAPGAIHRVDELPQPDGGRPCCRRWPGT